MSSTAGAIEIVNPAVDRPALNRQLAAAIGCCLLVLMVALAMWLIVRRLGGAFSQPLSALGIVAAAAFVSLVAIAIRRLAKSTKYVALGTPYFREVSMAWPIAPAVCAVSILACLTLPGTPIFAAAIAWLLLIGCEAAYWLPRIRPPARSISEPLTVVDEEQEVPAGLVQQITRVREEERESVHVVANVEIPAGDRLGVVHVAFCPPLEARPELSAHAMDADDIEVRVTQAESFGARVEARAAKPAAEGRSVIIEILGSVTLRQSA